MIPSLKGVSLEIPLLMFLEKTKNYWWKTKLDARSPVNCLSYEDHYNGSKKSETNFIKLICT